jgi:aspartyl-tRNA(Asn)/glutamyl-tRNA(Gln) amidotransferase subunit C
MPVSKAEVLRMAELAQLDISSSRLTVMQEQLERIIAYMERLDEVETDGVLPLAHPQELVNAWREDIPKSSLPVAEALKNAPQVSNRFFSVPKV